MRFIGLVSNEKAPAKDVALRFMLRSMLRSSTLAASAAVEHPGLTWRYPANYKLLKTKKPSFGFRVTATIELRRLHRRYRPCDRSPVVMYRAGSLRLALRAGFELSKEDVYALETLPSFLLS